MLQILLYVMLFYFLFRMLITGSANKRVNKVVELIKLLDKEEEFVERANLEIEAAKTQDERTKFQILKVWGKVYHKDYTDFTEDMDAIDLSTLIENTKMNNDDSFFYYFLAIPNGLQADGEFEKIEYLFSKTEEKKDLYVHRLDYALGLACNKNYRKQEDEGREFFENLMNGDYGEYTYSRQLIGLYKQIAGSMLVPFYENDYALDSSEENATKLKEMQDVEASFQQVHIGEIWLRNIGLEKTPEQTEENHEVIDAEVVKESEEETEKEIEDSTESGDSFVSEDDNK